MLEGKRVIQVFGEKNCEHILEKNKKMEAQHLPLPNEKPWNMRLKLPTTLKLPSNTEQYLVASVLLVLQLRVRQESAKRVSQ